LHFSPFISSVVLHLLLWPLLFVLFLPLASTNERKYAILVCETNLLHLTWWSPVPPIFFSTQHNFSLLNGCAKHHCIHKPYFLYSFINWWAPKLIP
jgi:hypothetical protein